MNLERCIEILTEHNKWRRAESPYDSPYQRYPDSAKELEEAIDFAVSNLDTLYHALYNVALSHGPGTMACDELFEEMNIAIQKAEGRENYKNDNICEETQ